MKGKAKPGGAFPSRILGDGVVLVIPRGRIDLPVAPALRKHLLDLVNAGRTRLVVDLSGVDSIDSSGLGALVSGFEAARANGGDLKIMAPGEQARLVLELTHVDRLLRTVSSAETAFDGHI